MSALIGVCSSWFLIAAVMGQSFPSAESQPTSQPQRMPAAAASPADFVVLSTAAYPADVRTEDALAEHNGAQADALAVAADEAADPLKQAELHLAAANWILARQAEPHVTRLLLGVGGPSAGESLRGLTASADVQLEAADRLLEALEADEPGATDVAEARSLAVQKLRVVHDSLLAFREAIGAVWSDETDEAVEGHIRRAASALGVLLEDEDRGVASAAALYQALLYQRAGRLDRALSVLELAFKPLPDDQRPLAFLSRLLRCRMVAQQGRHAVAWALLLRLEERAHDWLGDSPRADEAARAVMLVRWEVARAWQEVLLAAGNSDEAQWCQAAADRLRDALADAQPPSVIRAENAIPLMIQMSESGNPSPADDVTAPATRPSERPE